MAQFFVINANNPQPRLIKQAVEILRDGGVIAYPTDSSYALGCMMGFKDAQDRIRQIRSLGDDHLFTLICRNLSELSVYAQVDNSQFRLLKANTPAAYTFVLKATREVPRRLQHAKRSAVGIRVPNHLVVQALLDELAQPMLSMTLQLPNDDGPLNEAWEIRDRLESQVDLVIDSAVSFAGLTTVIDLTAAEPALIRQGVADAAPFGL
ncbi:L-threonylcarbamoyladenylate synthase [Methylotenera versatilis]|uniref:L-threonylcarbamoyladenylate synthase n=1 Tax=Methylotenera versatilis TaxID=1055487 RepID=UPI000648514F|nr:L-threonylcarbamoyladenylate synthase [Methylotenera versatilis]